MNKTFILAVFALLCAFSFAQEGYEECAYVEQTCMTDCCESAGGTFTFTEEIGSCEGQGANAEAASAAYMDCVASTCRSAIINCVAPYSDCANGYTSCLNSCKAGGQGTETCDNSCFNPATTCVTDYLAGQQSTPATSGTYVPTSSSCCGSAFILAFALLGAFATRKN